jgi:cell division protein ZapB
MASFEALLDRLDRLLLRYEEAQRRQALLESQVEALTLERDSLRSRLAAARSRIDALIDRLPADTEPPAADTVAGSPSIAGSTATVGRTAERPTGSPA